MSDLPQAVNSLNATMRTIRNNKRQDDDRRREIQLYQEKAAKEQAKVQYRRQIDEVLFDDEVSVEDKRTRIHDIGKEYQNFSFSGDATTGQYQQVFPREYASGQNSTMSQGKQMVAMMEQLSQMEDGSDEKRQAEAWIAQNVPGYAQMTKNVEAGISRTKASESTIDDFFTSFAQDQKRKGMDDTVSDEDILKGMTNYVTTLVSHGLSEAEAVNRAVQEYARLKNEDGGMFQKYPEMDLKTLAAKLGGEAEPEVAKIDPDAFKNALAKLSGEDKEAVLWAKKNPDDARAKEILKLHGVK